MASLKVSEIISDIFWFCGHGWFTEIKITDYFRFARDFHQRINCENICFCLMNIAITTSSFILTLSRRSCQSLVVILKNLPLKNSNEIQNPTITSLHAGSCIFQMLFLINNVLFSEFINLLTTEEIPDQELFEIFSAFDCDGKFR